MGNTRVLVIGAQFSGLLVARGLRGQFDVTVVDAKEYFEYTPGILRAYVQPAHLDALTFVYPPVLKSMGVTFLWGEVRALDAERKVATVKQIFMRPGQDVCDDISFDHCAICAGCNFGAFKPMGESPWFPTIHEEGQRHSDWAHIDERFLEARRRHIMEEHTKIGALSEAEAAVLVVGAGFIGVEWATELQHFFPRLRLTIIDFLPHCLGPLPEGAAEYCSRYMQTNGIKEFYNCKYDPDDDDFWDRIELPGRAAETYMCIGVKASNYFMPPGTLSDAGPGGGGWIHFNKKLQVVHKPSEGGGIWGDGSVYAVGDCNYGCIGEKDSWELPPIPKISYPGEEQAKHACDNIRISEANKASRWPRELNDTWWPWGAGMFATSLGPYDACFVVAANEVKGSGYTVNWGRLAAIQKEIIEVTKIRECKDFRTGKLIWHFVHHTPVNLWGRGPWLP